MIIHFSGEPPFKKGSIINFVNDSKYLVVNVYKKTWWKVMLSKLGFKVVLEGIKIKKYDI